jgi:hypothetical protein
MSSVPRVWKTEMFNARDCGLLFENADYNLDNKNFIFFIMTYKIRIQYFWIKTLPPGRKLFYRISQECYYKLL